MRSGVNIHRKRCANLADVHCSDGTGAIFLTVEVVQWRQYFFNRFRSLINMYVWLHNNCKPHSHFRFTTLMFKFLNPFSSVINPSTIFDNFTFQGIGP